MFCPSTFISFIEMCCRESNSVPHPHGAPAAAHSSPRILKHGQTTTTPGNRRHRKSSRENLVCGHLPNGDIVIVQTRHVGTFPERALPVYAEPAETSVPVPSTTIFLLLGHFYRDTKAQRAPPLRRKASKFLGRCPLELAPHLSAPLCRQTLPAQPFPSSRGFLFTQQQPRSSHGLRAPCDLLLADLLSQGLHNSLCSSTLTIRHTGLFPTPRPLHGLFPQPGTLFPTFLDSSFLAPPSVSSSPFFAGFFVIRLHPEIRSGINWTQ